MQRIGRTLILTRSAVGLAALAVLASLSVAQSQGRGGGSPVTPQGPGDPIGGIGVGALRKPSHIFPLVTNTSRERGAGFKTATDVFANLAGWVGEDEKKVYANISTSKSNIKNGEANRQEGEKIERANLNTSRSNIKKGWMLRPEGVTVVAIDPIETPPIAIAELEIAHEGLERQASMVKAGQTGLEVATRDGKVVGALATLTGRPNGGYSFSAAVQAVSGEKRIDPRHINLIGDTGLACNVEWFAKDPSLAFIPKGVSERPRAIFACGTVNGVNWMVVGTAVPVSPEKANGGYGPFTNDLGVKLGGTPFATFASAIVVGEFDIAKAMAPMLKHSTEQGGCWFAVSEQGMPSEKSRPRGIVGPNLGGVGQKG